MEFFGKPVCMRSDKMLSLQQTLSSRENNTAQPLLALRIALTTKSTEDVLMSLRKLGAYLNEPGQWDQAASQGLVELLATSMESRDEAVRQCAFVIACNRLGQLTSHAGLFELQMHSVRSVLRLLADNMEALQSCSNLVSLYFKTIAGLCWYSRQVRDDVLKVVPIQHFESFELVHLVHCDLKWLLFALHGIAIHGEYRGVASTLTILKLLEQIAGLTECCISCDTTARMHVVLYVMLTATGKETAWLLQRESTLLFVLSKRILQSRCLSCCLNSYLTLVEKLHAFGAEGRYLMGQGVLDVLSVIFERLEPHSLELVCRILTRLFETGSNAISLIVQKKILTQLVLLLEHHTAEVRNEANNSIRTFLSDANHGQLYKAIQFSFISALIEPLLSLDPEVVCDTIEICFLLMHCSQRNNMESYVLQKTFTDDLADQLNKLKSSHDQEVRRMANMFFNTYLRQEYEEGDLIEESSF